jgi:hypothetical protein
MEGTCASCKRAVGCRLWQCRQPQQGGFGSGPEPGVWSAGPTAECPWCKERSSQKQGPMVTMRAKRGGEVLHFDI